MKLNLLPRDYSPARKKCAVSPFAGRLFSLPPGWRLPLRRWWERRGVRLAIWTTGGVFLGLQGLGWYIASQPGAEETGKAGKAGKSLAAANESLSRRIEGLAPPGVFVVVDTAANRVYLRRGREILREMVASCGSGSVLEDPAGKRRWVFDTPRGEFRVQSKLTRPSWVKPDWAYIEEGEPIPSDPRERVFPGMLGEYAVGIGRGYFIHGTLYSRLLGRNVSHGCVRLGDEDLRALVQATSLGSRVIIY